MCKITQKYSHLKPGTKTVWVVDKAEEYEKTRSEWEMWVANKNPFGTERQYRESLGGPVYKVVNTCGDEKIETQYHQ